MSDHFRFGLLFDSSAPGPGAVVVCADAKQARLQETKRDDEVKSKDGQTARRLVAWQDLSDRCWRAAQQCNYAARTLGGGRHKDGR